MRISAAELDQAHSEIEAAQELQSRALAALAGEGDDVGSTLRNSLDAQNTLRRSRPRSSPLREYIAVGDFMSVEELVGMTGRALAAARARHDPRPEHGAAR